MFDSTGGKLLHNKRLHQSSGISECAVIVNNAAPWNVCGIHTGFKEMLFSHSKSMDICIDTILAEMVTY